MDHLPERKRRELDRITSILFEELDDKLAISTSKKRKRGRILKIILFGSYARGNWVDDPEGRYFSDYDLLVIVNNDELTEMGVFWRAAEDRILHDPQVKTTASLMFHTLDEVNSHLLDGHYFWCDIIRDGIMLYELVERSPNGKRKYTFTKSKKLTPQHAFDMASQYHRECRDAAERFLKLAHTALESGWHQESAFLLHQATESAYAKILLVFALYRPKQHNIKKLRDYAEEHDSRLRDAWPRGRKPFDRYFDLLRRAYIEARYSPHYETTMEILHWQAEHVEVLIDLVNQSCREHLTHLETEALDASKQI
ncbi:nucleotidyltransferase and HEPN domain-containing protein [Eilatimonas milleporae]|uniref:nucleotidyltransferase and HEPN domain-containing protein n=1 Tax=Eilatimonas milleporae TaxID=911205 RepID=UPI00147490E1|nr:nucleotidyltransferase and HEPN domain-containing protein [Eilatimonas milleporae]